MSDKPQKIECSACFDADDKVIQEGFSDEMKAILRFSRLFITGHDPAFCQKTCNSFYVCRRGVEAGIEAAAGGESSKVAKVP